MRWLDMGLEWTLLLQGWSLQRQLLAKQRLVVVCWIMGDWPCIFFNFFLEVNWAPINEGLVISCGFGDMWYRAANVTNEHTQKRTCIRGIRTHIQNQYKSIRTQPHLTAIGQQSATGAAGWGRKCVCVPMWNGILGCSLTTACMSHSNVSFPPPIH